MYKEGSWIPATPAKPGGSQLIITDKPDMVNCLDSEQLGEASWEELNRLSTKNMLNFDLWGTRTMGFTDLLELANVASTSDLLKPDSFLSSRDEYSIPSSLSFDLNSIPKANAEAVSLDNLSSKFVPFTPEQSSNKQASKRQILNNEIANKRIEVIEIDDDDSDNSQNKDQTQTHLEDNQNPDTEIDTSKTPPPQQQKQRRRKHRPKVVREGGKPARPRKPSVPKTAIPKELGSSGKRKYVRKKPIQTPQANTPSEQVNVESMESKIAESNKRSCRRSLNFDHHNNQVRDESSSYKPPSTFGTEPRAENFVGRVQLSPIDATHKERVMNTDNSTCSSRVCLNNTEQAKGLNRINSSTAMNAFGSYYNSLQAFEAAFLSNGCRLEGMNFPAIHMDKRMKKFYSVSTTSSTSTVAAVQNQVKVNLAAPSGVEDNNPAPQFKLAVSQGDKKLKKKKRKGPTKVGDSDSLFGTSFPAGTYQPSTCIETSAADTHTRLARKKHTTRNPPVNCMPLAVYKRYQRIPKPRGRPRSIKRRAVNSLEALLEQFSHLNISAEQYQNALVPYKKDKKRHHYDDQNALVLYQRDGTVVPFDGEFNPLKKRKPRPRVNLDDETSRVWKLLLQDINSVGVDGTDEEKAKWWDEERSVFRGRAESFIARMHLVQGDRRFSKWKGSVVDSCVGVFLTQNVSDHLSSSAFMALAARYPLKSKTSNNQSNKETTRFSQQPEFHVTEPEETIEWCADKPDWPVCQQSSMTIIDAEEVINSNESLESTSDRDILKKTVDLSAEEKETTNIGDDIEQDDVISSQDSVISSQNSVDSSSTAQNISSSQSSSETEPAVAFKSNVSSGPTSFLELLQMAQRAVNDGSNNEPSEWKLLFKNPQEQDRSPTTAGHLHLESKIADFESCADRRNEDICVVSERGGVSSESPKTSRMVAEAPKGSVSNQIEERHISQTNPHVQNFAGEILDVTESTNIVDNSKSEPLAAESKSKSARVAKEKSDVEDWDILRKVAQETHGVRERDPNTMDSVDWETIRCADVSEIAYTIRERGMNNMLAERIKDFLNRLVREHGSVDLEWLRDVPPDKAKQYLLSFRGLGLKSVECVRLLTLHHLAFPVDTNVGRIAVRLGWVPLQPLPESLQLHLLEMYPILESIQKFLWPRLCKLDQPTLYELHYQLITFGKVFCTKSKPNCNACPMRGECRHFASAFASARLALPAPEEKSIVPATGNIRAANEAEMGPINRLQLPAPQPDHQLVQPVVNNDCGPIIEEPASPELVIEVPPSPESEKTQIAELDIEDFDEIPTIKLNIEQFTQNLQNYMQQVQDGDMSKALVTLTQDAASLPTTKLKNVSRLRTEHQVYELPDSHPLLEGLDRREPDDPCSYLLAIWTPGETPDSVQPPEGGCNPQETGILCGEKTCFSCNNIRESNNQIVRGTLLIPCRTAIRGSFPLNGTYFQVNEVFADHDSSLNPIDVPRSWIWNLPRRTVYFGTSIPAIFKGLTTEGIQFCFWKGFVCVRGFEQKTRSPRPLMARLHFPASKMVGTKGKPNDS